MPVKKSNAETAKKPVEHGRPKAIIDWKYVDKMLQAHCNGTGIASMLGIHPDTLYNACEREFKTTFSAYQQQKQQEGKELLRTKQFSVAMAGDKTMLVWLGKQYLDQADKTESKVENIVDWRSVKTKMESTKDFGERTKHLITGLLSQSCGGSGSQS